MVCYCYRLVCPLMAGSASPGSVELRASAAGPPASAAAPVLIRIQLCYFTAIHR